MHKFVRWLIASSAVFLSVAWAGADTHVAADGTSAAIQAAINASVDGDVVSIPAGSFAWSGNVTLSNAKGITIQGAGSDKTTITANGNMLNLQTKLGNKPIRVTGIKFVHTNTTDVIEITGTAQDWRIDNCIFDDAQISGVYTIRVGNSSANTDSYTYGVIDHNQFINRNYATSIFVEWARGSLDPLAAGDWIWGQGPQRGTAQAVYIEDNVFSGTATASQVVDGRWGAKYVLRYNTIHNPWISTHSGITNLGREPLWVEIYKNTFTDDASRYGGSQIEMRSVSGIIWGNTSSSSMGRYGITIDHERSFKSGSGPYGGQMDGTRAFDENAGLHGYRGLGQPGWGPPQATNMSSATFAGVFDWGNRNGGTRVDMTIANNTGYTSEHIVAGRELFNESNMTIGPIASRPSAATVGPPRSVYVSTDENPQGATVYAATGTNTWAKQWEPYTYPHPLVTSQPGGNPMPKPTNLRVVQ